MSNLNPQHRAYLAETAARALNPNLFDGRHEQALCKMAHLFTTEQAAEAAAKKRAERIDDMGTVIDAIYDVVANDCRIAQRLGTLSVAEEEAGRRWPEGSIRGSRWDGVTIDGERSLLVQRVAFVAGAKWAHDRKDAS